MNFNSPEYLLFLPLVFALHWALPHRFRWALLLGASWLFYFHWHLGAGLLLVGTTLLTWLCARGIARARRPAARRALLALALAGCLGCLAAFKYAGFFASIAGRTLALKILLPVGISFYTFQTLSYVIDVYRGDVPAEPHFGYYALFVAFFPQLVAGPIERPQRLLPQLKAERRLRAESLRAGGWLLLAGYFKKLVVADALAPFVDSVYAAPGTSTGPEIALATLLFGIQIYCDFSGYTDIARGSAKLLGVELSENFRRPYAATSVREFWRRWHVSLTGWFTDYVYIPLGGNRRGLPRQLANVLVVFLLSGLWHGAGWNFVAWGLLHGLYQTCGLLWDRIRTGAVTTRPSNPALQTEAGETHASIARPAGDSAIEASNSKVREATTPSRDEANEMRASIVRPADGNSPEASDSKAREATTLSRDGASKTCASIVQPADGSSPEASDSRAREVATLSQDEADKTHASIARPAGGSAPEASDSSAQEAAISSQEGAEETCATPFERRAWFARELSGTGTRCGRRPTLWARAHTFLLVSFAWLFFRSQSLEDAARMLSRALVGWGGAVSVLREALPLLLPLTCLPLVERLTRGRRGELAHSALVALCLLTAIALAWLAQLAGGGQNAFIYFQF